jgi:hypothetical protein
MKLYKKIGLIVCCVVFLFSGMEITLAFSSAPTVRYDGKEKKFEILNTRGTDLFQDFKAVVPGDTITQSILLQFDNISRETDLYLRAESTDNAAIPEDIKLKFYVTEKLISESNLNTQGALKENTLLYKFTQSENVEVKVVLEVPTGIGNEISDMRKDIQWIFTIQEDDSVKEEPETDEPAPDTGIEVTVPDTGDDSAIVDYLILNVCSIIGIFLIFFAKKTE